MFALTPMLHYCGAKLTLSHAPVAQSLETNLYDFNFSYSRILVVTRDSSFGCVLFYEGILLEFLPAVFVIFKSLCNGTPYRLVSIY